MATLSLRYGIRCEGWTPKKDPLSATKIFFYKEKKCRMFSFLNHKKKFFLLSGQGSLPLLPLSGQNMFFMCVFPQRIDNFMRQIFLNKLQFKWRDWGRLPYKKSSQQNKETVIELQKMGTFLAKQKKRFYINYQTACKHQNLMIEAIGNKQILQKKHPQVPQKNAILREIIKVPEN